MGQSKSSGMERSHTFSQLQNVVALQRLVCVQKCTSVSELSIRMMLFRQRHESRLDYLKAFLAVGTSGVRTLTPSIGYRSHLCQLYASKYSLCRRLDPCAFSGRHRIWGNC